VVGGGSDGETAEGNPARGSVGTLDPGEGPISTEGGRGGGGPLGQPALPGAALPGG
jgi:hypothetical protein